MIVGGIGLLVWFGWQRVSAHMRKHPDAAKLVAEHVIAPLLIGPKSQEPNPEDQAQGEHDQTLDDGWPTPDDGSAKR